MKSITAAVATELAKQYSCQLIPVISIPDLGKVYTPVRLSSFAEARLLSIAQFQESINNDGTLSYSDCQITLDDSDGTVSTLIKTNRIVDRRANIYFLFYNGSTFLEDSLILLDGVVSAPINNNSGARTVSFTIKSNTSYGKTWWRRVDLVNSTMPERFDPWPIHLGRSENLLQEGVKVKEIPTCKSTATITNNSRSTQQATILVDDAADIPYGNTLFLTKFKPLSQLKWTGEVAIYGSSNTNPDSISIKLNYLNSTIAGFSNFGGWVMTLGNQNGFWRIPTDDGTNNPAVHDESIWIYPRQWSNNNFGLISLWPSHTMNPIPHGTQINIFITESRNNQTNNYQLRGTATAYYEATASTGYTGWFNIGIPDMRTGYKLRFSNHDTEYTITSVSGSSVKLNTGITEDVPHGTSVTVEETSFRDFSESFWYVGAGYKVSNNQIQFTTFPPRAEHENNTEIYLVHADSDYWDHYIVNADINHSNPGIGIDLKYPGDDEMGWSVVPYTDQYIYETVGNNFKKVMVKYPIEYIAYLMGASDAGTSLTTRITTPSFYHWADHIRILLFVAGYPNLETWFDDTFRSGSTPYDSYTQNCYCATDTSKDLIATAAQVAWEHRCGLRFSNNKWNLIYLSSDTHGVVDFEINDDNVEQGSLNIITDVDTNLSNEFVGEAGSYATTGCQNQSKVTVTYLNTNSDYQSRKKAETFQFITMHDEDEMLETLKFWGYRKSFAWIKIQVNCMLSALPIEVYDIVTINMARLSEHFSQTNFKCLVVNKEYDYTSNSVKLTLETPFRLGNNAIDNKYWTGDV